MGIKTKSIALIANTMSQLCFWNIKVDYSISRELLEEYHSKPLGTCYADNVEDISYDLQIVIPAYNVEKYIRKCMESVMPLLSSKYKVLVQVVDDGSTDDTGAIAEELAQICSDNVVVIRQENKGLSGARNTALKELYGEYIMLIDSDDYLPDGIVIDKFLENASGYDIIQGNWVYVDLENNKCGHIDATETSGFGAGKIYHHSVFKHFRFPEGYWFEDTPVTFLLCGKGLKVKCVDECLYCYRINPNGISRKANTRPKAIDSYWITELCLEEFGKFSVNYDQRAFDYFLHQCITNYLRTRRAPLEIRKAIFSLSVELIEKYFVNMSSTKYSKLESAIRNRQFNKYELLAIAYRCLE